MGPKWYCILGSSNPDDIPIRTDIKLDDGESIEKFHFSSDIDLIYCYIYTNSKRLWIKGSESSQKSNQKQSSIETLDMRFNNVILSQSVSNENPIHFPSSEFVEQEQEDELTDNTDNCLSSESDEEIQEMLDRCGNGINIELDCKMYNNVSLCNILNINETLELSKKSEWKISNNVKEPLTDIDNVTIIDTLIFFSKNGEHYCFNYRQSDHNNITELFTTEYHGPDNSIAYGKFILPFEPDVVTYTDNFLYMKCGSMNHVFTLVTNSKYSDKILKWYFFRMGDIDHTNIVAYHEYDSIYVLKDSTLYKYFNNIRGLVSVVIDKKFVLIKDYSMNKIMPHFFDDNKHLIHALRRKNIIKSHQWLEYIVGSSYSDNSDIFYVFVDVDSEKRMDSIDNNILINVHHTKYHSIFDAGWFINENAPNGLSVYFNTKSKTELDSFKNIESIDHIKKHIQCADYDGSLGEIVNVTIDNYAGLVMQTSQSTYYSTSSPTRSDTYVLHQFHFPCDHDNQKVDIDKNIIDRRETLDFNYYDKVYVDVDIRENPSTISS